MVRKPLYFTFNNICSLDVKDLYIVGTLPMPNSPNRRVNKQPVAGRSGNLRIVETDDFGQSVYDDIDKSLTLCYKGDDIDFIKRWLRGSGDLILSNQPDRYYKANIDNVLSIEKIIRKMNNFTIIFSCFPYAYLNTGDTSIIYTPTSTTWETIIMNEYDLSLPHLKIYGQGDIGVKINGVETDFYSVDGYIECDSELQQCYKVNQNLGMNMGGEFPVIYEGENIIEFTGSINKIELTPHWRNI